MNTKIQFNGLEKGILDTNKTATLTTNETYMNGDVILTMLDTTYMGAFVFVQPDGESLLYTTDYYTITEVSDGLEVT